MGYTPPETANCENCGGTIELEIQGDGTAIGVCEAEKCIEANGRLEQTFKGQCDATGEWHNGSMSVSDTYFQGRIDDSRS